MSHPRNARSTLLAIGVLLAIMASGCGAAQTPTATTEPVAPVAVLAKNPIRPTVSLDWTCTIIH